ncbi:MAG: hypothetical protein AMXMBFR84_32850 [Candidatus Hydrogenedentota bacterium]
MSEQPALSRRAALGAFAGAAAVGAVHVSSAAQASGDVKLKGRLKQSVCKWCYKIPLEELCKAAAGMGMPSIDLLSENEWPVIKQFGLTCAMANGPSGISEGWNLPADHDKLVAESERLLPLVKAAGLPNMIVFSGNRRGMDDAEGLQNCAKGLKRIMPLAESLGVTVCMELLNSKRNHKDYMCDHTVWGVELCKAIGSDRFKLLYDIYHMQIMEGDVIDTIREYKDYIGHYHTGGVPGRHEIDETQELNYKCICEAIVETGYTGYLAQEFIPSREDPIASLKQAALICDV